MDELDGMWWSASGQGPAVVVPWLNVDWTDLDLSALTERFRVVVVAPRGFGPSDRPGSYDGSEHVADIDRVLTAVGITRFATFGYSMSGALAARLAVGDPCVTAVACGGFPLTADLSGMGERARRRNAEVGRDPASWADLVAAHDPEAAVAFWDEVAALPRGTLADLACPVRVWWGEDDAVLASLQDPDELVLDLDRRGIHHDVVPGLDHDGMLARLDLVLPSIAAWLAEATRQDRS